MSKAIRVGENPRGRPSTGASSVSSARVAEQFSAIDAWITNKKSRILRVPSHPPASRDWAEGEEMIQSEPKSESDLTVA